MPARLVSDRRAERSTERTRPAMLVFYQSSTANRSFLRQMRAGMEEEGVPFRMEQADDSTAAEMAYAAAQASTLDVGVGVDVDGTIYVQHAKLPLNAPALVGSPQSARMMGHNAARLVNGTPFKLQ